jgi:hypothetical protein
MGIAEMFPSAVVEPAAPPRTTESPLVSYVEEPRFGISGLLDFSDMSVGFGSPNQVYEDAISLGNTGLSVGQVPPSTGQTIQGLADKFDVPSSVKLGDYEVGFPKIGPGRLEPTIDLQNRGFGLNYKIDIAQQDPQAFARDQALANQNRTQLEYPTIEDRGSLSGRSNPIPVERRSLYEGLAPPSTGLTLGDFAGPNPIVSLSDLSDSKNFGNPYAGTTGAFVPTRVEVDAQGRTIAVPVGFENGGDVPVQEGVGGLFPPEELARMDQASQELDALRAQGGGGLFSLEELARQDKISAAEIQPDGSMPGVDTLRHATPEEVDVGAYNYQKDLEDKLLYHVKERDKVNPFEFMGITADRKRFHQNQVEQVQKLIEDFRGQRGAAVANYRDYIAAGGRPLIVNTEEEPYFKSFPTDLINFRATKP